MNRLRSSRRLMAECARNVEVMFLLGGLRPDFRTIANFRRDNRKAIKQVFKAFVAVCGELNLLRCETFAIDGTKIRANNSIKKSFTPELLEKKLAYLKEQEAQLERYLSEMDEADTSDTTLRLDIKKEEAPQKLQEVRKRAEKYQAYQRRMAETGETQILETDPDCRTLHSKDGLHPAYNIQAAVDTGSHIIADFMTTNANTDQNLLSVVAGQLKDHLGLNSVHAITDKGYDSRADIEACVFNGIIPDVGLKYDKEERVHVLDYEPAEMTDELIRSTDPKDIQTCLRAGVLPQCYTGSNIAVEVQYQSEVSCFIRHTDGTVTCPMGRQLFKHGEKKYGTVYGSQEACRTCPNRCTDSKNAKTVCIGHNSVYVPVILYGNSKYPLQQIPDVEQDTPYNHFGKRKRKEARVMLTIKRDMAKQQLRKETVEHPFGTIKWHHGAHYFLCRGKEKVTAEIALSFTGYNMRRAINMIGVPGIVMHLRAKMTEKAS